MSLILSLTGSSGAGKSAIASALIASDSRFSFVESVTTRGPKPRDLPGEYNYFRKHEFLSLKASGGFLWTTTYAGNLYGTARHTLMRMLFDPDACGIIILTPDGVRNLRASMAALGKLAQHIPIYLEVTDEAVLAERMKRRGDEPHEIADRLDATRAWKREVLEDPSIPYRFLDNNGAIEDTVARILGIVHGPR